MKTRILQMAMIAFCCLVGGNVLGQEKKRKINMPKIIVPNAKTEREQRSSIEKERKEKEKNDEDSEFTFEESPTMRFSTDFEPSSTTIPAKTFEPVKDLNEAVSEDTATFDEGIEDIEIVEIEEIATFQGSDEQVSIASYFAVWDTRRVNPYDIDAKEFDDVVPIRLYDPSKNSFWSAPCNDGRVTSEFGYRWGRWHQGLDLELETGDPVYAVFDGVVRVANWQNGYGFCMVVRHDNGLETTYGHLSRMNFEPNTIVRAGDEIGLGGNTGRSTGSHLHFETMYEGNRFNPREIFNFPAKTVKMEQYILTSNVFDYLRGGRSKETNTLASELQFEIEDEKPKNIQKIAWVRIRPGDTLAEIAKRNNTSISTITKLNKISASSRIMAGRRLRIK